MSQERAAAKKMIKELPLDKRMEHIWMYYKWWIISILTLAILIGGTIYRVKTRPVYDLEIGFYAERYFAEEKIAEMEAYLSQFVPDIDGNGEKSVKIYLASTALAPEDPSTVSGIHGKFTTELAVGAYPVFLVDEAFYEKLKNDRFAEVMERFCDLQTDETLKGCLRLETGDSVYWATRMIYDGEQEDEKVQNAYAAAVATEEAVFGGRAEK